MKVGCGWERGVGDEWEVVDEGGDENIKFEEKGRGEECKGN
jgi:hypothetical protein